MCIVVLTPIGFTGLTAGYYEIAVTYPPQFNVTVGGQNGYVTSDASYTAYAGSSVLGVEQVNQESAITPGDAAGDFSAGGSNWHPTMIVEVTGTTLTVVLNNLANDNFVQADGVYITQVGGNFGQTGDAQLQPGSIAIAAGDPNTPSLSEPAPNGGRVDIGAYGGTAQSTPAGNPLIQVLSPAPLAKVTVGSTVAIDLRSAGLLPYDEAARIAVGTGNGSGVSPDLCEVGAEAKRLGVPAHGGAIIASQ